LEHGSRHLIGQRNVHAQLHGQFQLFAERYVILLVPESFFFFVT